MATGLQGSGFQKQGPISEGHYEKDKRIVGTCFFWTAFLWKPRYELKSRLQLFPLTSPIIVVPYIFPFMTHFKKFRQYGVGRRIRGLKIRLAEVFLSVRTKHRYKREMSVNNKIKTRIGETI